MSSSKKKKSIINFNIEGLVIEGMTLIHNFHKQIKWQDILVQKQKLLESLAKPSFGADKVFEKRNYPPGQHGNQQKREKI